MEPGLSILFGTHPCGCQQQLLRAFIHFIKNFFILPHPVTAQVFGTASKRWEFQQSAKTFPTAPLGRIALGLLEVFVREKVGQLQRNAILPSHRSNCCEPFAVLKRVVIFHLIKRFEQGAVVIAAFVN